MKDRVGKGAYQFEGNYTSRLGNESKDFDFYEKVLRTWSKPGRILGVGGKAGKRVKERVAGGHSSEAESQR